MIVEKVIKYKYTFKIQDQEIYILLDDPDLSVKQVKDIIRDNIEIYKNPENNNEYFVYQIKDEFGQSLEYWFSVIIQDDIQEYFNGEKVKDPKYNSIIYDTYIRTKLI